MEVAVQVVTVVGLGRGAPWLVTEVGLEQDALELVWSVWSIPPVSIPPVDIWEEHRSRRRDAEPGSSPGCSRD